MNEVNSAILEVLDAFELTLPVASVIALPDPWLRDNPDCEERSVDIRTFIESPDYLNAKDECWEVIKQDLSELFVGYDNPNMSWKYDEAVFDEGIGGGKSFKASIIITYLVYLTLNRKNPQEYLGLAKDSPIYFINMSVRSDQAKKVVFGEIASRVRNSPWFRNRGYLPNPEIKSELQFPKNINVIPGNSRETFPLGFNLLGGVMDEAAYYTETDAHDTAEEIYNALYNRIKKRFGNKGMLVMISSPRYVDDFIEKKMEEAKTNPKIFSRRRATFEAMLGSNKYRELYPSGISVTIDGVTFPQEDRQMYTRNPDRYKRDIMAIPSLVLEPYFKQYNLIEQIVDKNYLSPMKSRMEFADTFYGNPNYQYYMHIDLSLVSDSTGVGLCHNQGELIVVDLALGIDPKEVGGEIDLAEIRNLVIELRHRKFSLQKVTYDQYQSASSIQELNKLGITSEELSVDKDLAPYETLKELIYLGKIKTYANERLLTELRRLELIEGKKVDHPPKGSKDIADAVCGAVYNCVINQNIFNFGFSGDILKHKPQSEVIKEAETLTADGLGPYGYMRGRRV
jgi:hypothetical protein